MGKEITIIEILEDIRAADEILHKFERKYRIHSEVFYNLYSRGLLDDGEHLEDFAEWGGFYKLRLRREAIGFGSRNHGRCGVTELP
ncbi:MAG: hypothetical protein ISS50_00015 [Anaerolineae bacterium]|nr:hypothetical protein [Anaerolineae bacterium]